MTRRLQGGYGRRQRGGGEPLSEPKAEEKEPSFWEKLNPFAASTSNSSEISQNSTENSSENKVNDVIHKELVSLKESIERKLNELDEIKNKMLELVDAGQKVKAELIKLRVYHKIYCVAPSPTICYNGLTSKENHRT
jgi:hypothetical protein